jgi:ATP-dependent RNA helicase SUPV3L1/SUV3
MEETEMEEVGPSSAENNSFAAPLDVRPDFSCVQGFQVVGAESPSLAADQTWREALRLELEARAARLHQAVDAAIVLSNDGVIRWLGDPVAKLALGPDVLNPAAIIFADELTPVETRATIKTRIELWIAATLRRVLAPLFTLESLSEGSQAVRDLARQLVWSLGVLEREPIKAEVKALSQDDRAELRKQGVRFGAYYIFIPALIKPASRNLALQLWGVQSPGDADELLRALGSVSSSGRTSLPTDKTISKEGYRVAGYRPCGERAVRVDVVERLASMVRAALAGEPMDAARSGATHRAHKGFVVSGEMTSLTGCSGEQFASILRSMGFRSVEMKRSDFFASPSTNGAAGQSQLSVGSDAETPRPTTDYGAASPEAGEREVADDAILAAMPLSEANAETLAPVAPVLGDAEAIALQDDAGAGALDMSTTSTDPSDAGPVELVEGATQDADSDQDIPAPLISIEPSAEPPEAIAEGQPALPVTPEMKGGTAKSPDMITVWRLDHRKNVANRERQGKSSRAGAPDHLDSRAHTPSPPHERPQRRGHAPSKLNRSHPTRPDEKFRQKAKDYDTARSNPATAPQQKAKVDPNSPFAKLLQLRSLLEEQTKKRQ